MWFDPEAALKKIERDTPCDSRDTATKSVQIASKPEVCRECRNVAALHPAQKKTVAHKKTGSQMVLDAIDKGNSPDSGWQPRHGSIASETGLGGTVSYQLIRRLIDNGRITQAPDGVLSVVVKNEPNN